MTTLRKFATAALTAGVLSTAAVATIGQADARPWRGHRGGAVAAGVVGGLAAGALIGAAASSAYAYPYGGYSYAPAYYGNGYAPAYYGGYSYAPSYSYGYAPASYDVAPACWTEHRRVRIDPWTVAVRRVRVCE